MVVCAGVDFAVVGDDCVGVVVSLVAVGSVPSHDFMP